MRLSELEENEENDFNPFYISLSDLMVLLCVFLAMLVSMSKIEKGSFETIRSGFRGNTRGTLVELSQKLEAIVRRVPGGSLAKVHMAPDGVRLDLDTAALFDTGSAVLKVGALSPLKPLLREMIQTEYQIDVEGHTDDRPYYRHKGGELETNWSLSGRRASSVLHFLLDQGFAPARLRIVGYASNKPKQPIDNLDEAGLEQARAENRRVSLLVR